jgi:hypothetical protein
MTLESNMSHQLNALRRHMRDQTPMSPGDTAPYANGPRVVGISPGNPDDCFNIPGHSRSPGGQGA